MMKSIVPVGMKKKSPIVFLILVFGMLPLLWLDYGQVPSLANDPSTVVSETVPFRPMSRAEQWVAVLTAFGVKPFYMLISLILIILLWRSMAAELVGLRWSLIFFLGGEMFCAVNFLLYREASVLFEYLHSVGMVAGFGWAVFALQEGFDQRVVRLTDPHHACALIGLCRTCSKQDTVRCRWDLALIFFGLAAMVLCLLPLLTLPYPVSYQTRILGSVYRYSHAVANQLFEIRFCPLAAMVLLAGDALFRVFAAGRSQLIKKGLFSAGIGFLGFGLFRLFLFSPFRDRLVWFSFWEEISELLFILGTAMLLWIWRRGLPIPTGRSAATADRRA